MQLIKKKPLQQLFRLSLSALAMWVIFRKVDLSLALAYLKEANLLFILASMLTYSLSKVLAAFRVNALYRTQGLQISEVLNLKLTFLSMFYNLFIPLVGGDGYKSWWINNEYKTPIKSLVWAALLDRGSGLASLAIVTLLVYQISGVVFPYAEYSWLLIPLVLLAHWLVNRLVFSSFLPAWRSTTIYSFFIQVLQALTALFVVFALGIEHLQMEYVFVFMLASFAYVIPIIGAREMAFVFGSQQLGLNMELSLAIGLLFYLALAISSLAGYYFVIFPKSLKVHSDLSNT